MNRTSWWAHPTCLFSIPLAALALAANVLPAEVYAEQWRVWKHFDDRALLLSLAAAAVFALQTILPWRVRESLPVTAEPDAAAPVEPAFWAACLLAALGHAAAIAGGETLKAVGGALSGLGIAAAVLGCLAGGVSGWVRAAPLLGLAAFAAARAGLENNWLVLLELAVPALVTWTAVHEFRTEAARRLATVAPALALAVGLLILLAPAHWRQIEGSDAGPWAQSAALRMAGHAIQALNQAAAPEETAQRGLFHPMAALGILPGLTCWFALGVGCGWLHRQYRNRTGIGICLYPLAALALLTVPWIPAWTIQRAVPSLIWLAGAAWLILRRQRGLRSRRAWRMAHVGGAA